MPPLPVSPYLLTIILLIGSNTFMTAAWYWHLRFREVPLWQVILVSWGLAFIEYCLAVVEKSIAKIKRPKLHKASQHRQ